MIHLLIYLVFFWSGVTFPLVALDKNYYYYYCSVWFPLFLSRNKKAKAKCVNDPALLQLEWDVFFSGEKESPTEDIGLPLQPEDARLFYNSCSKTQVLWSSRPCPGFGNYSPPTCFNCLSEGHIRPTCSAASTLSLWVFRGQRGACVPCI